MRATGHFAPGPRRARRYTLYLLALALLCLPGCQGCGDSKTLTKTEAEEKLAEEKKKKKEEEKEPFEWGRIYSIPNDMERVSPHFKPGHWTEFIAEAWSNQADFSGELVTDPFRLTDPVTGRDVAPYRLGTSRPALLPKQQKKHLGLVLFVPPGDGGRNVHFRLTPRGSNRSVKEYLIRAERRKSWCYNLLVLTASPVEYGQLLAPRGRGLDTLWPGGSPRGPAMAQQYYDVRIPKLERYVPVSENALAWTSTAYVIWDGIDPGLLTPDQQSAMIDWIHWGGQLIISGPDSLDLLKDSFLSPYLPATAEADIALASDDLKTFADDWTNDPWPVENEPKQRRPGPVERMTKEKAAKEKAANDKAAKDGKTKPPIDRSKPRPLTIVQPWSGKKLLPVEDESVEVLATSDRADKAPLVLDRRVGLGRVALTAFRLSQKELRLSAWPSFDAFFNGCLLRRPPREFTLDDNRDVVAVWRDPQRQFRRVANTGFEASIADPTIPQRRRESMNAELVSRLRYFTRDAKLSDATLKPFADAESLPEKGRLDSATLGGNGFVIDDRPAENNEFFSGRFGPDSDEEPTARSTYNFSSGVAGWSDFNHPSQLARNALADAAGIVIPKAYYVAVLLLIYLAVLVPLNWLVFRIINRVEWAWIAAPIITIACTVAVIRFAELDIGFARSRTEIAVIEIQGEYSRAHVTRYTGVYTSLATSYDVEFDDPSSVIQPYAAHSRAELNDTNLFMRDSSTVHFRRDDKQITLTGFDVSSNSTGMLHAEHMLNVGGGIAARQIEGDRFELVNRTNLSFKGAAVFSRDRTAWIGDFEAGSKKTVTLANRAPSQAAVANRSVAEAEEIEETRRELAQKEEHMLELRPRLPEDHPAVVQTRQEIDRLKASLASRQPATISGDWLAEREQDQIAARARRDDVLKARLLVRLAENVDTLAEGELRLVAWTDDELPGMRITPVASQTRFANVVVAHLRYDGQLKHGNLVLGRKNEDLHSREAMEYRAGRVDDDTPTGDLDGDGVQDVPLDPASVPGAAQAFLRRYDRNRDMVLDANEWSSDSLVPIDAVDGDGDNKVTAAEIEAYFRNEIERQFQ